MLLTTACRICSPIITNHATKNDRTLPHTRDTPPQLTPPAAKCPSPQHDFQAAGSNNPHKKLRAPTKS